MEASNGQPAVVPIRTRIVQGPIETHARRDGGRLFVTFLVQEGAEVIAREFPVEEPGQKTILLALTGGIQPATLDQIPREEAQ